MFYDKYYIITFLFYLPFFTIFPAVHSLLLLLTDIKIPLLRALFHPTKCHRTTSIYLLSLKINSIYFYNPSKITILCFNISVLKIQVYLYNYILFLDHKNATSTADAHSIPLQTLGSTSGYPESPHKRLLPHHTLPLPRYPPSQNHHFPDRSDGIHNIL